MRYTESRRAKIRPDVPIADPNAGKVKVTAISKPAPRWVGTPGAARPVAQFSKDGKRKIARFTSVSAAANKTGFHGSAIAKCARGLTKRSYGFVWRYEDKIKC